MIFTVVLVTIGVYLTLLTITLASRRWRKK
jgi:hypothetical protein